MDTRKKELTWLQGRIFRLLCARAGRVFNQREISKLLGVSPTAVGKAIPVLKRRGLAKVERNKARMMVLVSLNRDSGRTVALKRVENLRAFYESGVVEFLEEEFPGCGIILFGSYSRGEDVERSDIDIAIIGSRKRAGDLSQFEKELGKEIRAQSYGKLDLVDKNLRDGILRGIVIHGPLELGTG